jgi:hypothetical protein
VLEGVMTTLDAPPFLLNACMGVIRIVKQGRRLGVAASTAETVF